MFLNSRTFFFKQRASLFFTNKEQNKSSPKLQKLKALINLESKLMNI